MAGRAALLLLPLALACASAAPSASSSPAPAPDDPLAAQLGDISACQARCAQSLPPPAKDAVLNACYRGCRLFSICHFVDPTAEVNATRAECESACLEAYAGGEEQFGCTTGCRTQLLDAESRDEKIPDQKPTSFSVFDLVSNFCNDIVSSAQSFISSTWTFYLQADDGKVVVFQSQPEIEYPIPEVQAPKSEVSEKTWTVSSSNTLNPHAGLREKLEKPPVAEPKSGAKVQAPAESQPLPEHDFLGCMSKRSGLPRWILAACLFLSIMVMLWLSCASLVTAPDQHVKTQPLSINGDKEYLDDLEVPTPYSLRPVIAVAICPAEENEEAGLLPVKVDLDKTAL
ncbi:transmembrane protein 59-like isoform X2 [Hemicordylus capensis]|uniref:transmembrane protein 59-like isoform X2 n=1 Tax=Hemicordylus capensis TaxID=884348 RepID=UPI002302C8F8|nr:transmembrane protein 59-like isoform X2 [Hemicordylus capensis]